MNSELTFNPDARSTPTEIQTVAPSCVLPIELVKFVARGLVYSGESVLQNEGILLLNYLDGVRLITHAEIQNAWLI